MDCQELLGIRFRRPQYGESKMRRYCIYIKSCSVIVKEHVNALSLNDKSDPLTDVKGIH